MTAYTEWHLDTRLIGRRVVRFDEVNSTNDLARELADGPAHDGLAVLAGTQTAGRGQYGRTWLSPPGTSVLLSVALFPPAELARPTLLTAWASVAVAEAIREATGWQAKIKWPNDVLLQGRKVCGILIERGVGSHTGGGAVVAGIGLNVNQSDDALAVAGLPHATSLAVIAGRSFDVSEVARLLLTHLDREYGLLRDGDSATLEACWKWRIGLLGKEVAAIYSDGSVVRGRMRELAFAGLRLEQADGTVRVVAPELVRNLDAV